jgi:hypothetical protein
MGSQFLTSKKNGNNIWLIKHSRRVVAKRAIGTKKVLYYILFSCDGITVRILDPKGKSVRGRYFRVLLLHNSRNIVNDVRCQYLGMFVFFM